MFNDRNGFDFILDFSYNTAVSSAPQMRNPGQVTALTSSQEVQLLNDLDNPNPFQRKMTAHNILRQLHYFLLKGKRAITKREKIRGTMANNSLGIFQIL